MAHYKTPYKVEFDGAWGNCVKSGESYVAFKLSKSNAEFICKACNLHDELVEACKAAKAIVASVNGEEETLKILHNAIAKAEAE